MIKLLLKIFIKDHENTEDNTVRGKYGVLAGVLGMCLNFILFLVKLFSGIAINSVAVISNSFENLSDMGSSLITAVGIKLSNQKPDREHPFGHGRIEYISSLIVSFVILLVGFELFKSSFGKILNPEELKISFVPLFSLAFV